MSDYKALYRKWRPFDFDDVCGQKGITDILKYEVANDKISHAYLFCGSRGTGKTSCAKILAKAVNCLNSVDGNPCNRCEACRSIDAGTSTDVIEMDAASNNGVGDVRTLKDEIAFTPATLKYRVYIIDEVHMMTGPAFNALLKTLEEPPSYVVFILATTEYNKLPTTIVSRCQRFDFRRILSDVIVERLNKIASAEGIDLAPDGALLIARAARGGMRDAVSLLELCAGSRARIDSELVSSTIGTGDRSLVYKLISAIGKADFDTVYSIIRDVVMSSGDISVFWQEIIDTYRDIMIIKNTSQARSYLDLTDIEYNALLKIADELSMARLSYHTSILENAIADMQRATNSKRSIAEIALTKMCEAKLVPTAEALAVRIEELEKTVSMMKLGVSAPQKANEAPIKQVPTEKKAEISAPEPKKTAEEKRITAPYEDWDSVIERISEFNRALSGKFFESVAFRVGESDFLIKMKPFFAASVKKDASVISILQGLIAELERKNKEQITVTIDSLDANTESNLSFELENLIK